MTTPPRSRAHTFLSALVALAVTAATLTACTSDGGEDTGTGIQTDRSFYWGPLPEPMAIPAYEFSNEFSGGMPDLFDDMPQPPENFSDQEALDKYLQEIEEWNKKLEESGLIPNFDSAPAEGLTIAPAAWQTDTDEGVDDFFPGYEDHIAEVEKYHEELDVVLAASKAGGEQGIAAWQSLLVASGIAVAGSDGRPIEVNGSTGIGYPMTDAELRLSAVAPGNASIPFTELAGMVADMYEVEALPLSDALLEGIYDASGQEFGAILFGMGDETVFIGSDDEFLPAEDIVLSIPQVTLILRRLSAEVAHRFDADGTGPQADGGASGFAPAARGFGFSRMRASGGGVCDIGDPLGAGTVKVGNSAFNSLVFNLALDYLADYSPEIAGKIGAAQKIMSGAAMLTALATFLMKAHALQADISLSDSPLPRTKTNQPGEFRDLHVKMSFDEELWQEMRQCISLFMGGVGVDPAARGGQGDGLHLDIRSSDTSRLLIGDTAGGSAPVTSAVTAADGTAKFVLHGAPQSIKLPEKSEPDDFTVPVRVDSNFQNADFWSDVADLLAGLGTAGLGALVNGTLGSVSRMKVISFTKPIPFRDWLVDAYFDVTIEATMSGERTSHVVYQMMGECGGGTKANSTTMNSAGSLYSPEPTRVQASLLSNSYYEQIVVFSPPGELWEGGWTMLPEGKTEFSLDVDYTVDQQFSNVGLPPLPEPVDGGLMGCGDGNPDAAGPTSDCGVRQFGQDLTVSLFTDRSFYIVGYYLSDNPWQSCGGRSYPTAGLIPPGVDKCDGQVSRTGSSRPPTEDIFNPEIPTLQTSGTYTCITNRAGYLGHYTLEWTMTFERVPEP